jgi:hypothetical protein
MLNSKKVITMKVLIILSVLFSASLSASGIHKWVDSEGNTHYGDAPPVSSKTEQVRVQAVPSDPGKTLPRLAKDKQDKAGGSEEPADQAAIACQQAREDQAIINSSSRIQAKSADGSLRYMTTVEIANRKEKSEADIEQFC